MKSCEELSSLFTARKPSVYRGFKRFGEEWRVKSRVGFLRAKQFRQQPLFQFTMLVMPKFSSRRIILRPAMAQNCPSRGQYCAITRQKLEWGSFQNQMKPTSIANEAYCDGKRSLLRWPMKYTCVFKVTTQYRFSLKHFPQKSLHFSEEKRIFAKKGSPANACGLE